MGTAHEEARGLVTCNSRFSIDVTPCEGPEGHPSVGPRGVTPAKAIKGHPTVGPDGVTPAKAIMGSPRRRPQGSPQRRPLRGHPGVGRGPGPMTNANPTRDPGLHQAFAGMTTKATLSNQSLQSSSTRAVAVCVLKNAHIRPRDARASRHPLQTFSHAVRGCIRSCRCSSC